MKRRWIVLLILLSVTYLFAPPPVIRFLALYSLLLILIHYLYLKNLKQGIRLIRLDQEIRTYRNQRTLIELVIENHSWFPAYGLVIIDTIGSLDPTGVSRIQIDLRPRSKRTISYMIRPSERGRWLLGPVRIHIRDLMGWEEVVVEEKKQTTVIVYPDIIPLEYAPSQGFPLGTIKSSAHIYEDPGRYRAVREYQKGDPLRNINWKASAHAGTLITNIYDASIDAPLLVLLNLTASQFPLKNRYLYAEQCIECAASLISAASLQDQMVGCVSTGILPDEQMPLVIPVGRDRRLAILDSLARIKLSGDSAEDDSAINGVEKEAPFSLFVQALQQVPYHSRVCYVGVIPGDGLLELFLLAQAKGCHFLVYCVEPTEEQLSFLRNKGIEVFEMEFEYNG